MEQNVGYGLKQERDDRRADAGSASRRCSTWCNSRRLPSASRINCRAARRQRVALARALARQGPSCCCSTSRSGALDKKLREQTQFEIMNIQEKTGITFVVVTHDQEEAMTLATRIAVMDKGGIRQIGTPTDIYEYPKLALRRRFHRLDQSMRGHGQLCGGRQGGRRMRGLGNRSNGCLR